MRLRVWETAQVLLAGPYGALPPDTFWCTLVKNVVTIWLIFHDFPGPRPDSDFLGLKKI